MENLTIHPLLPEQFAAAVAELANKGLQMSGQHAGTIEGIRSA